MAKLSLGMANLRLKWSMRLPPDKWKPRIKRGSAACSDIALTSLTALLESADAFPPLKSAVGGVLALWNTVERVKTSKEKAKALSRRAYKVLEALTDAVPDPSNISPSMLMSIQCFDSVLIEACNAMAPLTKRRRLLSLNRDEATLELFNRRLDESFQTFTIAGLTRVETQLLAIKADATVVHQTLNNTLTTLTYRFTLIVGLF
ncbi:hypothetical protein B0H14DRAFT_2959725 [Mycena olivaceomarginata]|nr:hypothetical protein B0H14DRAFT_2959725 [Mycena olivaceomarginata]